MVHEVLHQCVAVVLTNALALIQALVGIVVVLLSEFLKALGIRSQHILECHLLICFEQVGLAHKIVLVAGVSPLGVVLFVQIFFFLIELSFRFHVL